MSSGAYGVVSDALNRLRNVDADYRFMALNDLMAEAKKPNFSLDETVEAKTIEAVLGRLEDVNSEVKNQAVKCIGVLVKRARVRQLQAVVDKLIALLGSKEEELRDIASLGLKTVVVEIPTSSTLAEIVTEKLAPRLVAQLGQTASSAELLIETLEVLGELFQRFQSIVSKDTALQSTTLTALFPALSHNRAAVRKRAIATIGNLIGSASDEAFGQLAKFITTELESDNTEHLRSIIQLLGNVARYTPQRTATLFNQALPKVGEAIETEDDDLREICLQTYEVLIYKCPSEITPFITSIIKSSVALVQHDPNYVAMDDDDEEMDEGEDEEEEEEEQYTDDDDVAWKVRRAAAKTLSALASTRPELLTVFYRDVVPTLISRLSEREESVRLEVFATVTTILRQTRVYGGAAQASEVDASVGSLKRKREEAAMEGIEEQTPLGILRTQAPALVKAVLKQLGDKSVPTRLASFGLLRELVRVLNGGLESSMSTVADRVEYSLKDITGSASSGLPIEVLSFLGALFATHPARSYQDELGRLLKLVVSASALAKYHKLASEAFAVFSQLVQILKSASASGSASPTPGAFRPHIQTIYDATVKRVGDQDAGREVKEAAIGVLADLLVYTGDALQKDYAQALPLLRKRLGNDVTRLASVKAIARVAKSPTAGGAEFDKWIGECINDVAPLLRQNNRALKTAAFDALAALLQRSAQDTSPQLADTVLSDIAPFVSAADLHLVPVALDVAALLVQSSPDSARRATASEILPQTYALVQSPLLSGPALDALLRFYAAVTDADTTLAPTLVPALTLAVGKVKVGGDGAQAYTSASKAIGTVVAHAQGEASALIAEFTKAIQKNSKATNATLFLSLLTLGEIGRSLDLSAQPNVFERVLEFFSSDSEEIKSSAAFAAGNIAVGSNQFLPVLVQQISSEGEKRYLSLQALKEVIAHSEPAQLALVAEQVWTVLFAISEDKEQATRNVAAECLGKVTVANPGKYLPQLQTRLRDESPLKRATVTIAVRYTFTDVSTGYDELLAPLIVDFLSLIHDSDLTVRRLALSSLNSAARHKPHMIREHLEALLPLLYGETTVKPELIREITLGPFKEKIDDGLDIRKIAFETMYTLLDSCLDKLNVFELLGHVMTGLKDLDEVKVLSYLMLIRLAEVAPPAVSARLDEVTPEFVSVLRFKPKDTATKMEIERASELQRSVLRTLVALAPLAKGNAPTFEALINEIETTSSWKDEFRVLRGGASGEAMEAD